jgi:predicted DNA-binding ribbon-helix-helix protein
MIRKSMRVGCARTSIKLEVEFWTFLEELAAGRGLSLAKLVSEVAAAHPDHINLASRLRRFALAQARSAGSQPAAAAASEPHSLVCPLLRLLLGDTLSDSLRLAGTVNLSAEDREEWDAAGATRQRRHR